MTPRIAERMTAIRKYFTRVLHNMGDQNFPQALANAAELAYQTESLYKEIEVTYREHHETAQTSSATLQPRQRD